jgi:hypothetical protein
MKTKLAILVCALVLLGAQMPLREIPLEIRIDVHPQHLGHAVPLRTPEPYHTTATVRVANTPQVLGVVDLDVKRGETKSRTESVPPYRITFQTRVNRTATQAVAEVSVSRGDRLLTRQTSDIILP